MTRGPLDVLVEAIRLLDSLDIPYMLGGSVASSIHGVARFTDDADIVIDLRPDQVESLAQALERDFYVSREAMREAKERGSSFNAIHLESVVKIDFFVLGGDAFDREQFRRRTRAGLGEPGAPDVALATAEDMVLRKLLWFRSGGEVSEQQWRDVLGILRVRRGGLDDAYMKRWAAFLEVVDLLERALVQAGSDEAEDSRPRQGPWS